MKISTAQKKLALRDMVKYIEKNGELTKTALLRNLKFNDGDFFEYCFNEAFSYGKDNNYISVSRHNYTKIGSNCLSILEDDYYEHVEMSLENHFKGKFLNKGHFLIAKTARRNSNAGRWTRPDFTIISSQKFPYIPGMEFDVITFEVKRPDDCGVLAVFEALSHNSAATKSFVFFPISEDQLRNNPQGERIVEECSQHGIGLILMEDEYRLDKCFIKIDARRKAINNEKCSHFLQNVLDADQLAKISAW